MSITSGASAAARRAPASGRTSIAAAGESARGFVRGLLSSLAIVSVGYAIGQSRRLGGGREVDKIDDLASRLAGLERGLHGVTGTASAADRLASPPAADPGPVVLPVSPPLRPATAPPLPPVVRRGQIDKPYAVNHYAALAHEASRERQLADGDRRRTAIGRTEPLVAGWLDRSGTAGEDRRRA